MKHMYDLEALEGSPEAKERCLVEQNYEHG
jgi:hypothetical protein